MNEDVWKCWQCGRFLHEHELDLVTDVDGECDSFCPSCGSDDLDDVLCSDLLEKMVLVSKAFRYRLARDKVYAGGVKLDASPESWDEVARANKCYAKARELRDKSLRFYKEATEGCVCRS